MDHLHLLTGANKTISVYEQASEKHFNKSVTSSDDLLIASVVLNHFRALDFYAVLSQLTVGVTLNVFLLASVVTARHQTHAPGPVARRTIYSSSGHSPMPVIDQIITFIGIVTLLRLLIRAALILATLSSNSFLWPSFCYLHGFLNTFLQNFHLWTTTLLLNDRYIAHLDPSSYLSKCSHFVLYITLTGVAFLSAMHFAAPIYGFAAYRFLTGELTCALDHHSHFACPYVLYTLLLVSGPALLPMLYWTVLLTARQIKALSVFQSTPNSSAITSPHHHQPCSSSSTVVTSFHQPPKKKTLYSTILNSKPVHLILPCCSNLQHASTTTTLSTNTFNLTVSDSGIPSKGRTTSISSECSGHSSSTKGRFRKNNSVLNGRKAVYQRPSSSSGSDRVIYLNSPVLGCQLTSSSSISRSVKSHLLTSSKELKSVTILSWAFLLASAPKLVRNTCTACFSPSPYPLITDEQPNLPEVLIAQPYQPLTDLRFNFYLAYLEETTSCLVVPFILLAFHSKLRFSLILFISALLTTCRSSFSHFKFRGNATRRASARKQSTQNRSSRHLRSASVGRAASSPSRHKSPRIAADPQSLPPTSANECDELRRSLNRSNSLRINYPTNNSVAKTSNHFLSEHSIAVTVI